MVERHHRIDFATGAMVFPGGKVEPGDRAPEVHRRCVGVEGLDEDGITVRVAAIRETFEESGVLLALDRGTGQLLKKDRLAQIDARFRTKLDAGDISMRTLLEAEDLLLECQGLVRFAHWITPVFMPKRFDTEFYLVEAPADQLALHDGREAVDSIWTTVNDAIADQREGRRTIIFPTLAQLQKLGRSQTVSEAIQAARSGTIVTVLPELKKRQDGTMMLVLPADAGYDIVEAPVDNIG
jgi:8-oxo-dGTP pyrophosphatase MutT (NUDIX family)